MNYADWLIDAGDAIIEKKSEGKVLTDVEKLIYCLWVADYSMMNAGDLESAKDLYPSFLSEGRALARKLGLPESKKLFEADEEEFTEIYDSVIEGVCLELQRNL